MLQLKIPPPVYLLLFAGLMWLVDHFVPWGGVIESPWNTIGIVLVAAAILLDIVSLGLFFRARTTFNPIKPENTRELVTVGSYRLTRNPMYLGMVVILTGWGIWLGSILPFLLIPLFMVVLTYQQILPEERILEEKFGETYLKYKRNVRRWL